jgi:hypothetical protein
VKDIHALFLHLTTVLQLNAYDSSDLLRSEIVYSVSSFDKFIHDLVRQGMVDTFIGNRPATDAYMNFDLTLKQYASLTSAGSIPPPETVFENAVFDRHKSQSFQEPDKVAGALSLIWSEPHKWQKIAANMLMSEGDVRVELKNIVFRRNQIVHEGDIDLATGDLQQINSSDVARSVHFIERLAACIYGLI